MEDTEIITLLINERSENALLRIKDNPRYKEICKRQDKSNAIVERLYDTHFNDQEKNIIVEHYEGELDKRVIETDDAYLQGLTDCFKFLKFLELSK